MSVTVKRHLTIGIRDMVMIEKIKRELTIYCMCSVFSRFLTGSYLFSFLRRGAHKIFFQDPFLF